MDIGDLSHEHRADVLHERKGEHAAARTELGRLAHARVDQRIGEVQPGDADHHLLQRIERRRREAVCERSHHLGALADRARHRPGMVEARREREAALERDEPVARLEAGHAAARRWNTDRAARVASERRVGEPGRQRRRRAAARAARHPPGRRGVGRGPVVGVDRGDAVRELVQVRLSDIRVTGRLEAAYALGGPRRDVVGEDDRAVGRRQAFGVEEILDREGDAVCGLLRFGEKDAARLAGRSHTIGLYPPCP